MQRPTLQTTFKDSFVFLDVSEEFSHVKPYWGVFPPLLADHRIFIVNDNRHALGQEHMFAMGAGRDCDFSGVNQKGLRRLASHGCSVRALAAMNAAVLRFVDFKKPMTPMQAEPPWVPSDPNWVIPTTDDIKSRFFIIEPHGHSSFLTRLRPNIPGARKRHPEEGCSSDGSVRGPYREYTSRVTQLSRLDVPLGITRYSLLISLLMA